MAKYNVKDAWTDDIGYMHFELASGEVKRFSPLAIGYFGESQTLGELEDLLDSVEDKITLCTQCAAEIKSRFRQQETICAHCQALNAFDDQILADLAMINKIDDK